MVTNFWVYFIVFLKITALATYSFAQEDPSASPRKKMVAEQIQARGISNKYVLEAMLKVPRHNFVPQNEINYAYADRPLPIGYGQTISQPYIVAYMTEVIEPRPPQRLLEIGSGSGYQAAVLAEIVSEVYSIEIIPELGNAASARLKKLGYQNIEVKISDGYYGWQEKAPFDAIVVTAAVEYIPPLLIAQLKDGGKMVIPVGSPFFVQTLTLIEKKDGQITAKSLMPVLFVPFRRTE